jgi:predicted outer membrane protein
MAQLTMTRALATVTAVVALTGAAACGSNESAPPQTPASSTTTTSGAAVSSTEVIDHTDAHIAACLAAANQTESSQAQRALQRSTDPRLRDFDQRLMADRTEAELDEQSVLASAGISPMADETSDMVRARGDVAMTNLGLVSEADFDKEFLDTIVREQQSFLSAIDSQIPVAQHGEVRALLERTRAKVAEDLATATEIQASLPK